MIFNVDGSYSQFIFFMQKAILKVFYKEPSFIIANVS